MSLVQRLIRAFVPGETIRAMEPESQAWLLTCPGCEAARSVRDAGGIRWKAKGESRIRARCAKCGQVGWHRLARSADAG